MLARPIDKLTRWDYRYSTDSVEASIFEAWEFMIATYMHEYKVADIRIRRNLWALGDAQMFFYK